FSDRRKAAVVGSGHELQFVPVVGPAEQILLFPFGSHFQAVHGAIKVATFQAAEDADELVLLEFDRPAKLTRNSLGDFDFEADEAARILRIFENVGSAALSIGSTDDRSRSVLVYLALASGKCGI